MAHAARYYTRSGAEIVGPQLIWADRLAIAAWLLTGGVIGLVYALWGDPGTFAIVEQIAGVFALTVWFIGRVADFAITGRIRH